MIPTGLITILLFIASTILIVEDSHKIDITLSLSLATVYFFCVGFSFQFCGVAFACRDRFRALNELTRLRFRLTSFEVVSCVELHKKLTIIIQKINEDLMQPLILILGLLMMSITLNVYQLVRLSMITTGTETFMLIINFCWFFVYFYLLVIAIYASEITYKEGEKFIDWGKEALWSKNFLEGAMRTDFKFFLATFDKTRLKFQTIFFDVDWKLLLQVNLITLLN